VCDPVREVKRECNSCAAQKEKENGVPALSEKREVKWNDIRLSKKVSGGDKCFSILQHVRWSFQPFILGQTAVFFVPHKLTNSTFSCLFSAQANKLLGNSCCLKIIRWLHFQ
jgi:hypothetical protein